MMGHRSGEPFMWQQSFLNAIAHRIEHEEGLIGLFVAGSFGTGTADEYSDVDLLAIIEPEKQASFVNRWRSHVEAILPIVFWYEARIGGPVFNAIGRKWERIDLTVAGRETLPQRTRDGFRPLIDPHGLYQGFADSAPWQGPNKAAVSHLIREFIRVLGLLPVAIGRGEYLTARAGLEMLRMGLFQLLSEEVERVDKGGMLAWSRRLSSEQLAVLESIPNAELNRPSLIDAHLAVAGAFLPRAQTLAERWDIPWPADFEAATWDHLRDALGIRKPVTELLT